MDESRKKWSLLTSFWVALGILVVSTVTVLMVMKKPIWLELETLAGVICFVMTGFYWWVLYHGVRFNEDEKIAVNWIKEISDVGSGVADLGELFLGIVGLSSSVGFAKMGLIGIVVGGFMGLVLSLLACIVLMVLAWVVFNAMEAAIFVTAVPLFLIFRRSVLYVLQHVDYCVGNMGRSLWCSLTFSVFNTAVLCLVVFASHKLVEYWL